MTIKDSSMQKQIIHRKDSPGQLATTAMTYRVAIDSILRRHKASQGETPASMEQCFAKALAKELASAPPVFDALDDILQARESKPCTDRCSEYFWDIFPYKDLPKYSINKQEDCSPRTDTHATSAYHTHHTVKRALQVAKDLTACKYFLETPCDTWPENTLFKKEQAHARSVTDNKGFTRDRDAFYDQYGHLIANDSTFFYGDTKLRREIYDEALQTCTIRETVADELNALIESFDKEQSKMFESLRKSLGDQQSASLEALLDASWCESDNTPLTQEIFSAITRICERYALKGFNRTEVIPQQFRVSTDGNTCVIEIPNYLKLDWKRNIPTGLLDMIRSRRRIETDFYPHRVVTNPSETAQPNSHENILNFLQENMCKLADGKYRHKYEVLDAVLDKYGNFITEAVGDEERRRQLRRFMQNNRIAWPSRR